MDYKKFQEIKEKALEEHIPIILDDTLEEIEKYIKKESLENILEIGTAVRVFCYMLF